MKKALALLLVAGYLGAAAPELLCGGRCDCQPGASSTVPEPHTPRRPALFGATCAALPEEAPSPAAGRSPVLGRPSGCAAWRA